MASQHEALRARGSVLQGGRVHGDGQAHGSQGEDPCWQGDGGEGDDPKQHAGNDLKHTQKHAGEKTKVRGGGLRVGQSGGRHV